MVALSELPHGVEELRKAPQFLVAKEYAPPRVLLGLNAP